VREHRGAIVLAAVVAVLVGLGAAGVLPDLPDPKRAIEDIAQALGPWTYALVGVLAFLETGAFVGLLAPGETTVIVGGVVAGQGEVDIVPLVGLVWTCCVLGDLTSYAIGRRLGREFLVRHGPKLRIGPDRLERVESYFREHGGKTILVGRFIGLVRALAPFIAGSSGLPLKRFLPFSVIGCGLWASLFSILGFVFYRSFDRVADIAGQATLGLGITVAVVAAGVFGFRRLRRARDPRLRFLRERLTPGDLGLELTSAVAISGVGLYVFLLYASLLHGGERTTPADSELLDLAGDLRSQTGVDVVEVVTDLGSFATVATLVFVTGIVLLARRRVAELLALVTGSVLLYLAVHAAKAGVDRPRPPMPLAEARGASYPSGHAAYGTIWIAVALVVARVTPGLARRTLLVGVAVAIAVAVGLSRVYLRVHYWSDVAGGWALAAALLGGVAALALVVEHVRNNEPGHPASAPWTSTSPPPSSR
jgi:membrane protein DedA with SNARE-associated domain/membrane-associated phospholipid phosphatase